MRTSTSAPGATAEADRTATQAVFEIVKNQPGYQQ
mgnify:CR=1 FL=1